MDPDIDDTIRALEAAGARHRAAVAELAVAREAVQPAVIAALRAGARQTDVIRASGYSRATVRNLARAHGIGPR